MKKLFLIVICSVLMLTGCRKNFLSTDQKVYFQSEYVNHAWGYQHSGFLIDVEGHVLVYEKPEGWHFPDENMNLTVDQVSENLSKCNSSGKKVPVDELERYASYIQNIASSKLTSPKNEGADMGSHQITCYQLQDNGKYKVSLVSQKGDISRENLNFYSKRVVAWINEIAASLQR